jgi:small subunit ribosomal protein S18
MNDLKPKLKKSKIVKKEKKNIKQSPLDLKKKKAKGNWKQRLVKRTNSSKKPFRKSLLYIFLLKKFKNIIEYTNLTLLKAFLTKFLKIYSRKHTRIKAHEQRKIAHSIRKARFLKLIPFTKQVIIKRIKSLRKFKKR